MATVICDCGCGGMVERKVYAGVACRVRMLRKRYKHDTEPIINDGNDSVTDGLVIE